MVPADKVDISCFDERDIACLEDCARNNRERAALAMTEKERAAWRRQAEWNERILERIREADRKERAP